MKVYALFQPKGEHEEYEEILIAVYANKEKAEEKGKELDKQCILTMKDLPMPLETWLYHVYGRTPDGNHFDASGKYTSEVIEEMDRKMKIHREHYDKCIVKEASFIE